MNPERWTQIEQLYHAALEREPAAREVFLDEACAGDEMLRRQVMTLLKHDDAVDFIETPALEIAAQLQAKERAQSMIGRQIGYYKILSLLGAGGMGEVHLALDTRLNRKVAIKLLPAEFTTHPERVRRFAQEARTASALNHPNIITIYEIGEAGDMHYIVTEYVEGETLRQRMSKAPQGSLSLAEALDMAVQVSAALAAAHGAGIIHRDIKPENMMVRLDGIVKVLDFGLAKLTEPSSPALDAQATILVRNIIDTAEVMGTPRYMSPEQARGEKVDARTDIFSLGVVLYEMLAGRGPFIGATASDCLAAILKDEPPNLMEMNSKVPPQLERVVRRCLEKQPMRRFHSAHDLGYALEAVSLSSSARLETATALPPVSEIVSTSSVRKREWLAWAVAALLLATLGLTWAYFTRQPTADARVMKFSILPPEKSSFGQIAVSPDGRYLAFTAATGGMIRVWVRALDSTEARALAGTQGAIFPFWSPDSRFIGFFADGRLKKIEASGGPVQTLCEAPFPLGGAWGHAGVILFGPHPLAGLWRISATGGEPTQVTTRDNAGQEVAHAYPTFLPDGRHFLYSVVSGQKETRGVYIGSLDETLKRRLLDQITFTNYLAAAPGEMAGGAGLLVFGRGGALLAQHFAVSRLEFTGEPFSLSDKVGSNFVLPNYFNFSVSDNGVLVFDPSLERQSRQYLWRDRRGQQIKSLDVAAGLFQPWLSPDEKRFIADRFDPQTRTPDLWMYDVSGGNAQRFTFDPADDFNPVWSPDGSRIVWVSDPAGIVNIYQKAASGAGKETLLLKSDYNNFPTDWSRDGRFIIYQQDDPKTKYDIWVLPTSGSGETKPFPVVRTKASEMAGLLSPDGRWLAYASDESEHFEVYLQSFPGGGGKRQVSTGGGHHPRWRRDGRELFYYAADGKLMAAPVRSGESLETGTPTPLFEFRAGTAQGFAPYAVTADGQRFLINAVVETEPNAALTVIVNWTAVMKK